MLRAFLLHTRKSVAELDALDRPDTHERVRDVGFQPVEDRLAQTDGNAGRTMLSRAPIELPSLRSASMYASSSGTRSGSAQKNGF